MRPRKKDRHLPPCVHLKHGAYYLVKRGKWIPLGRDYAAALSEYAKTVGNPGAGNMPSLIDDAMNNLRPSVGPSTWGNYQTASRRLKHAFADIRYQDVTAQTVWEFRDKYHETPNMTNRCLTLLRHVFNYAIRRGKMQYNPAIGVEKHAELKRDRLISSGEYRTIYEKAGDRLQVIMDLCYLTGQRVGDVLKIGRQDITTDGVYFRQQKTGKKLLVEWTPELKAVVERAKGMGGKVKALTLLQNRLGRAPDYTTVKLQWDKARRAAGILDAQMRDLRAMSLTEAEEQGKNPTALAAHSSESMTKRYLRGKKIAKVSGPSFRQS